VAPVAVQLRLHEASSGFYVHGIRCRPSYSLCTTGPGLCLGLTFIFTRLTQRSYEPTHAIEVSLGYKAIKVIDLGIGN
jgi:hypothetical protein